MIEILYELVFWSAEKHYTHVTDQHKTCKYSLHSHTNRYINKLKTKLPLENELKMRCSNLLVLAAAVAVRYRAKEKSAAPPRRMDRQPHSPRYQTFIIVLSFEE
jgi:hypothetical protein